jgi:fructose-1-phosphate kinase PfkB-like protein
VSSTVPHIYTLTGNLLAERTLEIPSWQPGGTYRAQAESFQVGGKGINVSKMLNRLGVANTALCFSGGPGGLDCETWLRERGFTFHAFRTGPATRTGLVVRSPAQPETTFLGADVAPDAPAVQTCAEYLDAQPPGQVLALCGSFPGWTDAAFDVLRDAIVRWLSRGCVVADTYGPALAWLVEQPLELLKVNASELASIGLGPAAALSIAPLRYVITDGPGPVRLRDGLGAESQVVPPAIREVSATGSGDVLLACLLDALFRQRKSLRDAVDFALPYAAANAAHAGVAEFPFPS